MADPIDPITINSLTDEGHLSQYLLPTPRVFALWGYVGHALPPAPKPETPTTPATAAEPAPEPKPEPKEEVFRLYFTLQFNDYVEFRVEDVVAHLKLGKADNPLGGTIVWLRAGAQINRVHVDTVDQQAGFLQGGLFGGNGASGSFPGWQGGGGLGMGSTYGGCNSFVACGGGSFGGCNSFVMCGGGSFGGCNSFVMCGGTTFTRC